MRRQRTKAEYQAQAMLLGLHYATIVHVFYGPPSFQTSTYLDADTMEPVDRRQSGPRYGEHQDDTYADGEPVRSSKVGGA